MIGYILIALSAVCNALMDHSAKGTFLGWWDKNTSWKNKYKNGDPRKGPRFFGSTTFLVWLTDGWHLLQMLFLNTLFLGLIMVGSPFKSVFLSFIIIVIGWKIIFEITYRILNR